jgi:hypothetical protein
MLEASRREGASLPLSMVRPWLLVYLLLLALRPLLLLLPHLWRCKVCRRCRARLRAAVHTGCNPVTSWVCKGLSLYRNALPMCNNRSPAEQGVILS